MTFSLSSPLPGDLLIALLGRQRWRHGGPAEPIYHPHGPTIELKEITVQLCRVPPSNKAPRAAEPGAVGRIARLLGTAGGETGLRQAGERAEYRGNTLAYVQDGNYGVGFPGEQAAET